MTNQIDNKMKALLLLFLCFLPFIAQAQMTKRHTIARIQNMQITRFINFEDENPVDTIYVINGRDSRYTSINYITLAEGSIHDIHQILKTSLKMFAEEKGTSIYQNGVLIASERYFGGKIVALSSETEPGFTMLSKSQVNNLLSDVEEYLTH